MLVHLASQPLRSPRGEGTAIAEVPPTLGGEDHPTWANPAALWVANPVRPSLLWHRGDFPGDVCVSFELKPETEAALRCLILAPSADSTESEWLSGTVHTTPSNTAAAVECPRPGAKPILKQVTLDNGQTTVRLVREKVQSKLAGRTMLFTNGKIANPYAE
ncbi:MAG: hypothetical protein ACUVX8_09765 [Candidatus Zipacnadales bacterium]